MAVLVCGGAGYIGSHAVADLLTKDEEVVVIDNLQTGHKEAVVSPAKLYIGDLRDQEFLEGVFFENDIESVMHFAADSLVGESMSNPLKYYENNVYGTMCLLKVMKKYDVKNLYFHQLLLLMGNQIVYLL